MASINLAQAYQVSVGLKIHQGGVRPVNSLEWQSAVASVRLIST